MDYTTEMILSKVKRKKLQNIHRILDAGYQQMVVCLRLRKLKLTNKLEIVMIYKLKELRTNYKMN